MQIQAINYNCRSKSRISRLKPFKTATWGDITCASAKVMSIKLTLLAPKCENEVLK